MHCISILRGFEKSNTLMHKIKLNSNSSTVRNENWTPYVGSSEILPPSLLLSSAPAWLRPVVIRFIIIVAMIVSDNCCKTLLS
jgi:hypothetical protein